MKKISAKPEINCRARGERGGLAREPQPIKRKVSSLKNK
jgi:hypothetical protein